MIKEDVRMKKWAPRVLLAAALAGLSAFLLKGDVWTFSVSYTHLTLPTNSLV